MRKLGLQLGISRAALLSGGGSPPVASSSLDAPVNTALSSKTLAAYGFARLVEGYTGNTYRALRVSDNAEQDFGFDSDGIPDYSALTTWAGASDVKIVHWFDQAENEGNLPATDMYVIEGGNLQRFGTNAIGTDGQFTRSTTTGSLGANTGDDRGYAESPIFSFDTTSGMETHWLYSMNERKVGSGSVAGDRFGGNTDDEYLFFFGKDGAYSSVYFRNLIGASSNNTDFVYLRGTTGVTETENSVFSYKQNAQNVATFGFASDEMLVFREGFYEIDPLTTSNQADILNADFDDCRLLIGNAYTNSTGSVRTNQLANMLFGGVIITTPLTATEGFFLRQKLALVGQPEMVSNTDEMEGFVGTSGDILVFKNAVSSTGLLTGEKGNISVQINQSDFEGSTPDITYDYTDPDTGLEGVRFVGQNKANFYTETGSTYLSGKTTFGMGAIYKCNDTTNDLSFVTGVSDSPTDRSDRSFVLGVNHSRPIVQSQCARDRDPDERTGRRNELIISTGNYVVSANDGINQGDVKYDNAAINKELLYTDVYSSPNGSGAITLTEAILNKTTPTGQDWEFDTIIEENWDNLSYPHKDGALMVHFGHTKSHASYDRADTYETRKNHIVASTTKSFITTGLSPLGHIDGGLAINEYCSVSDSNDGGVICNVHDSDLGSYNSFEGVLSILPIWDGEDWTLDQKNKFALNYYKFLEA